MVKAFSENSKVHWNWGSNDAEGFVKEVFRRRVTRTIKGQKITRNGGDDNPAYLIQQADGDKVLKLHSELKETS